MHDLIQIALNGVGIYLLAGLIFANLFVFLGIHHIDPAASGTNLAFRLIILPGCVVFWPYLMWRWIKKSPPPEEFSAHRFPRAHSK